MTYTTLTYAGVEKSLADWGISTWRRESYNQASDTFAFSLLAAADSAEQFPFGAMITLKVGRTPSTPSTSSNSTLPQKGVTSWTGGHTWFVGYRVENIRTGSYEIESLDYKFAGPWDFFFERLVFEKLWLTWNGTKQIADWRSQVVLGWSVNQLTGAGDTVVGTTATNLLSIAQQVIEIAQYVAAQSSYEQTVNGLSWPSGPQIQFDTLSTDSNGNYQLNTSRTNCKIPDFVPGYAGSNGDIQSTTSGLVLRAPLDAVNDLTCAECMRRQLRWIGAMGSPVIWWDYTTSPPTLKVSTRDQLSAVALPLVGSTESLKLKRRDDLIPPAIAFKYRISGQMQGTGYTVVVHDIAATIDGAACEGVGYLGLMKTLAGGSLTSDQQTGLPNQARRFGAQNGTFDFEGESAKWATASILTTPLVLTDPSASSPALAFWTSLFPELAQVGNLAFYNAGSPGVQVLDTSGAAVNTATYANLLLDGQVAPWMYVNNTPTSNTPGLAIEATITAYFTYNETGVPLGGDVNTSSVQYHPYTCKVKLTNLSSGTYQSSPQITQVPEPVPYGLPGYIYAIESIPQYQGTFSIVEQEITDACPIGNNLNITGGLAEWATMAATVQQVTYDDKGQTTLTLGPAQHLGNSDLVERLRVNRGPRWLYLIGGDLLNQDTQTGPMEFGKNLPKQSPGPGNKVAGWQLFPNNLVDLENNPTAYLLPPGVALYPSGSGAPGAPSTYGELAAAPMAGPGWSLGNGSAGSQGSSQIICDLGQFGSLQPTTYVPIPQVAAVRVTNGGTGYTTAPTVAFSGGGGTGAAATAIISGGKVVAIKMTNFGAGYTSAPTVAFSGGGGAGAAATARNWGWEARFFEVQISIAGDCNWFMSVFGTPPYQKQTPLL
jgi:hypothetical protein